MKPGVKTTEFWLTLVAVVGASVVATMPQDNPWVQAGAALVAALSSMGYSKHRADLKMCSLPHTEEE